LNLDLQNLYFYLYHQRTGKEGGEKNASSKRVNGEGFTCIEKNPSPNDAQQYYFLFAQNIISNQTLNTYTPLKPKITLLYKHHMLSKTSKHTIELK
jgi:hypothetical protein